MYKYKSVDVLFTGVFCKQIQLWEEVQVYFLFFYLEFVQIFKGRLDQSHRGSDLIPFIKQREKETRRERLRVS